jgi:tRNA1(Val) A37 N6-methylase TrmN6
MKNCLRLKREDETLDTFYHGRILVLQKRKGYRFSVDAPLLAAFIETREGEELLEIGGGCGIISLLLSLKPWKHITCLEIQPALADLARRNVALNQLEGKITVVEADIRDYRPGKKFDVIFSNPPYFRLRSGWVGRCEERALARHEISLTASEVIEKMEAWLKPEGRGYLIYPMNRYKEIMELLARHGLKTWRLRLVFSKIDRPPRFFLVEAGRQERPMMVLPPLVLFEAEGQYTEEAKRIFAGPEAASKEEAKRGESRA